MSVHVEAMGATGNFSFASLKYSAMVVFILLSLVFLKVFSHAKDMISSPFFPLQLAHHLPCDHFCDTSSQGEPLVKILPRLFRICIPANTDSNKLCVTLKECSLLRHFAQKQKSEECPEGINLSTQCYNKHALVMLLQKATKNISKFILM